mmetsp:Transcript_14107/g.21285  ORF Transcript_14107/g.21285 Transcript_14107/m.21285 type:complete len:85 (-) Transcript_14107:489-743(-)
MKGTDVDDVVIERLSWRQDEQKNETQQTHVGVEDVADGTETQTQSTRPRAKKNSRKRKKSENMSNYDGDLEKLQQVTSRKRRKL